MKPMSATCRDIQDDLVATAIGEADGAARTRVLGHVADCPECRDELERIHDVDASVASIRLAATETPEEAAARSGLAARLADLRRRILWYGVFESPFGRLFLGRTELGVALVGFLGPGGIPRPEGLELIPGGDDVASLHRELLDHLEGRSPRVGWPLDLRLAKSAFQRAVLEAAGRIPFGAVTSYAHLARELGCPKSVRAVAQALRRNPLPLVIPCHRVVGAGGDLTGYDGNRVGLKRRILAAEGIPSERRRERFLVRRAALYVRDREDAEYCLPSCGSLPRRSLADLTLFASRERAESCGLRPCSNCRPDLHPLSA